MWAKGLPSSISPSKVRKTGRTGSEVRLSVTIIRLIGWEWTRISSQTPSTSSILLAAVMIAEARSSFSHTCAGAASTTSMLRCGAACLTATAAAKPTYPAPTTIMSSISQAPVSLVVVDGVDIDHPIVASYCRSS
ncbi:hypothetical protein D3C87_1591080 [compost metagenome]